MKNAIIAGSVILLIVLLSLWLKVNPSRVLITMIAYWVYLDRLERKDRKDDDL